MQQSPAFAEPKPPGRLVGKVVPDVMLAAVGVPSTTGLPASAGQGLTPAPSVKRKKNTGQPRQRPHRPSAWSRRRQRSINTDTGQPCQAPPPSPRVIVRAEATGNACSSATNRGNDHDDRRIGRARLNRWERIVQFRRAAAHLVEFI